MITPQKSRPHSIFRALDRLAGAGVALFTAGAFFLTVDLPVEPLAVVVFFLPAVLVTVAFFLTVDLEIELRAVVFFAGDAPSPTVSDPSPVVELVLLLRDARAGDFSPS